MVQRVVAAVAAAAVVGCVAVLVALGADHRLPSAPRLPRALAPADCVVGGVEMDHDDAERLARAATDSGRRTVPARVAAADRVRPDDVARVTRALEGRTKAALTCRADPILDHGAPRLGDDGLTQRAHAVRVDVARAFGPIPVGGFAPGGVRSGHTAGSAHYEGRAIDVFFRPISTRSKVRGWALAHYLVANADRLEVQTVIFDGRIWSRWRSAEGWRHYDVDVSGVPERTRRILEHRDHVHVDV